MKYKAYIYGAGFEYNRLSSIIYNCETIEIKGIVTTEPQSFSMIDGMKCIRPKDIQDDYDLVIIAVVNWRPIYCILLQCGVPPKKIIRSCAFYSPCFDIDRYVQVINKNVSIICNNCLGGIVSYELGLEFLSPTKNMGCLDNRQFVRFIEDIEAYVKMDMIPRRWVAGVDDANDCYEYGIVGDVEWHLNHDVTAETAVEKWEIRKNKVNLENLAVIMTLRKKEEVELFDKIQIKNKIGFYFEDVECDRIVYTPEWCSPKVRYENNGSYDIFVTRSLCNRGCVTPIDWLRFINGEENFMRYRI